MMNRLTPVMVLAVGWVGLVNWNRVAGQAGKGSDAAPAKPAAIKLPECPVMNEPVSFAVQLRTDDGPVYFCCKDCIKKYQADPAKYAAKVAAQRKTLADRPKVQTTCPVTGEPAKADVAVDHSGQKVRFCCKGCVGKFQKEPEKYKAALANSYTYQTKCPVTGEDIDAAAFTESAGGQRVYFCCKNCVTKYSADPKKYAPSLAAQGFVIEEENQKKGG